MIYSLPAAAFERLSEIIPSRVACYDVRSQVDMTQAVAGDIAIAIAFERLAVDAQIPGHARYAAEFSVTVFVAETGARESDKAAAESLFVAAIAHLIGWEVSPGRFARLIDGPQPDAETGIAAFGFGFAVPVFVP